VVFCNRHSQFGQLDYSPSSCPPAHSSQPRFFSSTRYTFCAVSCEFVVLGPCSLKMIRRNLNSPSPPGGESSHFSFYFMKSSPRSGIGLAFSLNPLFNFYLTSLTKGPISSSQVFFFPLYLPNSFPCPGFPSLHFSPTEHLIPKWRATDPHFSFPPRVIFSYGGSLSRLLQFLCDLPLRLCDGWRS